MANTANFDVHVYLRPDDQMKSYPVAIDPELVPRLENALAQLNIKPMQLESGGSNGNTEFSILVSALIHLFNSNRQFVIQFSIHRFRWKK